MRSVTLVNHNYTQDDSKKRPMSGHNTREVEERDTRIVSWIVSDEVESSLGSAGTKALEQLIMARQRKIVIVRLLR